MLEHWFLSNIFKYGIQTLSPCVSPFEFHGAMQPGASHRHHRLSWPEQSGTVLRGKHCLDMLLGMKQK